MARVFAGRPESRGLFLRSDPRSARAERLIAQALTRLGWTELDLVNRSKGHPAKLELAHQLRAQTTLSVAWVAQRLSMGTRAHLTWLLKGAKPSKSTRPQWPVQAQLAI